MPAVGERKFRAGTTDIASDAKEHLELPMGEKRWPEHRLLKRRHAGENQRRKYECPRLLNV
jgi:hypothetical protein